jgi:hypothetical protein
LDSVLGDHERQFERNDAGKTMLVATEKPVLRLFQLYGSQLRKWADHLERTPGTIVAISRKGPRLIELMVREGILAPSVMDRVVTERALPFLTEAELPLIVTDDAVAWGSTFLRIFNTSQQVAIQFAGNVIGVPFAVSDDASDSVRECIDQCFLRLQPNEVSPFVTSQVRAFRTLGKPLDMEYPIESLVGDFSEQYLIEVALADAARELGGKLIPVPFDVATSNGVVEVSGWTIVRRSNDTTDSGQRPPFSKVRIYLDSERRSLSFAVMQPFSLCQSMIADAQNFLPKPLASLWKESVALVKPASEPELRMATERSLAVWLNFLLTVPFTLRAASAIYAAFDSYNVGCQRRGMHADDLRLLVGPSLAYRAQQLLNDSVHLDTTVACVPVVTDAIPLEKIPDRFKDPYESKRNSLLRRAVNVDDALQAIFFAQHHAIELPSRGEPVPNVDDRLDFGITLDGMINHVRSVLPDVDIYELHTCLDRLIDEGCVVPRYLNLGSAENQIWVRVFRVGEGPLRKSLQTVRLLFDKLSAKLGDSEISRFLLEKYTVLALTSGTDNPNLVPLRELHARKRFHPYGARAAVPTGSDERFILDLAVDHEILQRPSSSSTLDESSGAYRLNEVEGVLPRRECPWDENVGDALEDLATFVKLLNATRGIAQRGLTLITSLASRQELHKALEAELNLWLNDRAQSVYHALSSLVMLADSARSGGMSSHQQTEVNGKLRRAANFTAQARTKIGWFEERGRIIEEITAAANDDQLSKRVWRDLRRWIESKYASEHHAPGLTEIESALKIAGATNRLLRDLYSSAVNRPVQGQLFQGDESDERAKPIEDSISAFRSLLADQSLIDHVTRTALAERNGRPDIDALLAEVRSKLPLEFWDAVYQLRPVIHEIADRCADLLREFGSEIFREQCKALDPPLYILMWDIRGWSGHDDTDELNAYVARAHSQIRTILGDRGCDFRPESRDDGNGLICSSFSDVLAVFRVLTENYAQVQFRAGVEVNLQGRLNYYPISKALGGLAYAHAARVCTLFKEIEKEPHRWQGEAPAEPEGSYLVIGEFARRYAQAQQAWSTASYTEMEPSGTYAARVRGTIPISVTILHSNQVLD